jgi:hypothetical protein
MIASEEISLDRSVPDVRMEECKFWNYPNNLPKVISHQNTITNIPNNLPKVICHQYNIFRLFPIHISTLNVLKKVPDFKNPSLLRAFINKLFNLL